MEHARGVDAASASISIERCRALLGDEENGLSDVTSISFDSVPTRWLTWSSKSFWRRARHLGRDNDSRTHDLAALGEWV
jgi:hypothetical protein